MSVTAVNSDIKSSMPTKKYDHVFSLGEACLCATALAKNNLRSCSSPFDWCYGATFEERAEMLLNDFADFINQEDLELIGTRDEPEPCNIYLNNKNKIVFNHDFALNKPLDETYPSVHKKYQRRIDRLLKILTDSKRILIVYIELADTENGAQSTDNMISYVERLNKKYPQTQIDLLYMKHDETMADKTVRYKQVNDNIIIAELFSRDPNGKNLYSMNKRNISKALSYVRSTGQLLRTIQKQSAGSLRLFYRRGRNYVRIMGIKVKLKEKKHGNV